MRVIKYFFEEPTLLDFPESASESPVDSGEQLLELMRDKRHFRGYLAASDLENNTVGGSSLEDQAAARVLAEVIGKPLWFLKRGQDAGNPVQFELLTDLKAIVLALTTMTADSVVISDLDPKDHDMEHLVGSSDRKQDFGAIVRLLNMGATVVFPEPAHVGHDWSVFSAKPLSGNIRAQMAGVPKDCRCFVVPYVKARGEHKFYFEQYDLELFSEFEVVPISPDRL